MITAFITPKNGHIFKICKIFKIFFRLSSNASKIVWAVDKDHLTLSE